MKWLLALFLAATPALADMSETYLNQGLQGTSTSPWYINLRNNAGTEIGTSGTPVRIDPTGTTIQPISGTVTDNQGTSPWVTSDLADGSVSGGTAGTKSIMIGGQYNTTLPTLTNGQQAAIQIDSNGRIVTSAITGFGAAFSFGDIVSGAVGVVRRTAYTEPTSSVAFSIKSASANDTSAGTGARTVTVYYFDGTNAIASETVTMNGTTCVNSTTTIARYIEKVIVATAGSGGANAGILTLYTGTGCSTVVGTIALGDNQTFWAHHYVPTGKVCNITGLSMGSSSTTAGNGAAFYIKSLALGVSGAVEIQVSDFPDIYGQASTVTRSYASPIKVNGPARVTVWVAPNAGSSTYRASIDYFEP